MPEAFDDVDFDDESESRTNPFEHDPACDCESCTYDPAFDLSLYDDIEDDDVSA